MTLEAGHAIDVTTGCDCTNEETGAHMALKTYRPTTPSLRHLVQVDRSGLWKGAPVKVLVEGKSKTGGRNTDGRITTRHIGGGHKQSYRFVDFRRRKHDHAGGGRAPRVRSEPHRLHRADQVHRRRALLHPGAAAPGCRRQRRLRRQGRREAWQRHAARLPCRSARSCTTSSSRSAAAAARPLGRLLRAARRP